MQNDQEGAFLFIIRFIRIMQRIRQTLSGRVLEMRSFIATMAFSWRGFQQKRT